MHSAQESSAAAEVSVWAAQPQKQKLIDQQSSPSDSVCLFLFAHTLSTIHSFSGERCSVSTAMGCDGRRHPFINRFDVQCCAMPRKRLHLKRTTTTTTPTIHHRQLHQKKEQQQHCTSSPQQQLLLVPLFNALINRRSILCCYLKNNSSSHHHHLTICWDRCDFQT